MKAALASAVATIAPMMLSAVPAIAANLFVANQDPTAQDIRAVCMSPHVDPATITVTGVARTVGQPDAYTVASLGTCHIPSGSVWPTGTVVATAFTDPSAKDMAWHVTDLAYAPPAASNLAGIRAPEGASVFSGPADAHSTSPGPSSLADTKSADSGSADSATFTNAYSPAGDTSGADAQHKTNARTGAMTITVARFGDYGSTGPVSDRLRMTDVDPYQPADASAPHNAPAPSSVFITQPDTNSALPADDFAWHVGVAPQTPKPNSVGAGAHRPLSATVARQGVSPTYTDVLAGLP